MTTPRTIETTRGMQETAEAWRRQGLRVGLVPTMGYLHEGHLSLVDRCRQESDVTVVSIFVNPLQFGPAEDYAVYPRDLERDLGLLAERGVEAVFHPSVEEVYPPGFATHVEVSGLTEGLCGAFRPGHFRGVTTVVTKLFTAVRPHVAVFGQKDYQQAAVIRRLERDLNLGIRIAVSPTVREADGLAMSSRNVNLTAEERARAPVLFAALSWAREQILAGQRETAPLATRIRQQIQAGLTERIDYVEVADAETLAPVRRIAGRAVIALAVRVGRVRLIDNVVVEPPG
ncbi:MAG: pantoate--beta-alanine ligase [Candidatus Latescibacterota bacterium]